MKAMTQVSETRSEKSIRRMILQSRAVQGMAALFSAILGEEVSAVRAVHLLNAQLSFGLLLTVGGASVLVAVLLLVWFGLSVWQCSMDKSEKNG